MDHLHYMQIALKQAELAASLDEVPVGAVICCDGRIVSQTHNLVETTKNACAHAEILAIQQASQALGTWRLTTASLYVTLEPCPMCMGAIILSRIPKLYFGAWDERMGAAGSRFDLSQFPEFPSQVEVHPELLQEESEKLLKEFFRKKR